MVEQNQDAGQLVEDAVRDAARICGAAHTLDIQAYLDCWLPLRFPNKGLVELFEDGRVIEIWHEAITIADLFQPGVQELGKVETVIDHYGNSHQRDYCLVVMGHRFEDAQRVMFRGVLGRSRLYKLVLTLILAGCPADHIRIIDTRPDVAGLAAADLGSVVDGIDLVAIGGEVVAGRMLARQFGTPARFAGQVVSGSMFAVGGKSVLLTTFPYGDLCYAATRALIQRRPKRLVFVGAAGALDPQHKLGDLFTPEVLADKDGAPIQAEPARRRQEPLFPVSPGWIHGNVRTPLLETVDEVNCLRRFGVGTVDVEAMHFQLACRDGLIPPNGETETGILLYVSDVVGSAEALAPVDFGNLGNGRRRVMETLLGLLENE